MDYIRWPYRADMVIRLADGSLQTFRVQWQFASDAAKPLPFAHGYGSSAYYDVHGYNLDGPGELVETGRVRNRRTIQSMSYNPRPCPDDPVIWNAQQSE